MPTYGARSLWTSAAAPPGLDSSTIAWISNVFAQSGTVVSSPQAILVNNLIVGLKSDGVWDKLDEVFLFAVEDENEGLNGIVLGTIASAVSSPTFTVDRGFTGNGSSSYVDSNYNPTTDAINYSQDSACFFAWNNTSGVDSAPLASQGVLISRVFPQFLDTSTYIGINGRLVLGVTTPALGVIGHYLVNRLNATTITLDLNGTVPLDTESVASVAVDNSNYLALSETGVSFSSRQCCCLGMGGGLSEAERSALYSRLRTYMTAKGVP